MNIITKIKNIMSKSKVTTITEEQYDTLWARLEDKLDDLYNNNPDSYDLDNYDLILNGNEILIEYIQMGYKHNEKANAILKLLIEEGVIKLKDNK